MTCYCQSSDTSGDVLLCKECSSQFHMLCLKSGRPSNLAGDVFFQFTCALCSSTGVETFNRMKLQWLQVVMLTLYNLHLSGAGKNGFFRWKEHICSFIERNWLTLFGPNKHKTSTWHGTVAGTLSSGCPQYFKSGARDLKENGWWCLTKKVAPDLETLNSKLGRSKVHVEKDESPKIGGLRSRRAKTSIESAMELKAKRFSTGAGAKLKTGKSDSDHNSLNTSLLSQSSTISIASRLDGDITPLDSSHSILAPITTEAGLLLEDQLDSFLKQSDDDMGSDIEVDPCGISPPHSANLQESDLMLDMEDVVASLPSSFMADESPGMVIKEETFESMDTSDISQANFKQGLEDNIGSLNVSVSIADELLDSTDTQVKQDEIESNPTTPMTRSVDNTDENTDSDSEQGIENIDSILFEKEQNSLAEPLVKCVPLNVYEQRNLLHKLKAIERIRKLTPEAARLKRKLICRQLKQERGVSLYNLDAEMKYLMGQNRDDGNDECISQAGQVPQICGTGNMYRVLDRYQTSFFSALTQQIQPSSFFNRLVGTEDDQLQSIYSPFTARMLKPFIRRDYESRPMKMCLLHEIQAYAHRNDPSWQAQPPPPIDYCYVRPQHIASVNTLCREFFWPGIDLSECLQYPDFSCIALYRKFVIGFAFLVPDVQYNESYISFLFVHPEWRGAGIATFMLYHLIQTCMGKDITLHVSASNPAMVLYQKFGFKPEEFILDFYDKYFPEESKECRHAFFLRLAK